MNRLRSFGTILAVAAPVALAGCANNVLTNQTEAVSHGGNPFTQPENIKAVSMATPTGSAFNQALTKEYVDLAKYEADIEYDWFDSDFYSRKGLVTAADGATQPEDPMVWRLKEPFLSDLGAARAKLVTALDDGGRQAKPGVAAVAQARFDCWVEEQEEGWQTDRIAKCKSEFEAAYAELIKKEMAPAPAPAMDKATFYTVFFDFDSYQINPVASRVLNAVAADWAGTDRKLKLVGHTDSSGASDYNKKLSDRRAASVRDALAVRGIGTDRAATEGVGEGDLAVPTADGVREPRNRRVVISVQ